MPVEPPIQPMLARIAEQLPPEGDFLFEPKWDGFRAIVFRGEDDVYIQSRDLKPLDRYFPELHQALLEVLPAGCVVDGEIVIVTPRGLDFDALQLRLHPAASRIAKLATESPASFVAFDLLAVEGKDVMASAQRDRRAMLEALRDRLEPPLYLTPITQDRRPCRRMAAAVRRRGAGRRDRQACRLTLSAGKAGDAQGQAHPHGGLRRGGLSLVQGHA